MDSFINNKDIVEWPTGAGHWWFYGNWNEINGIHLCEVFKNSMEQLIVTTDGHFMFKSDVEEHQFIPATLPEVP